MHDCSRGRVESDHHPFATQATAKRALYTPFLIALSIVLALTSAVAGCNGGSSSTPAPTPTAAGPTFSPTGGTFTSAQSVTLADATPGAAILYTLDGSPPTAAASTYSTPIPITSTATINAIAMASGYLASAPASATYTINLAAAATPQFSPAPGNFTTAQSVTITDTTPGAAIYYTLDGSTPTASSLRYSVAIAVPVTTTLKAIAVATGASASTVASGVYMIAASGSAVSIVLTTHDQSLLLAPQASINFTAAAATANQVIVDETQQYQTIEGWGAAFTDSAAYLVEKVVPTAALPGTLNDLFTRDGSGIGLSFMRVPMGASDLVRSAYTFDDLPAGQTDPTLSHFSIDHDNAYILPLVVQAKALNPQMKLMANPWSPPAWMKDSASLQGGHLLASMYSPFANYFVKYLQAYQAAGVSIDYISLQNEPLFNTAGYPSLFMDAATQTTVLRDSILPALTANSLTAPVLVYDHNWDQPGYPEAILSDPVILASAQVAGTAWHGYGGTPGAQQTVQNFFPAKGTWETEHSGGTFTTDQFTSDFVEITHVMRNASRSFLKWSLALNQAHGPNLSQIPGGGFGGCNTCNGILTVDSASGAVTRTVEFYTLGQYSKYVLPGAKRIFSSNVASVATVAFLNPDASKVLVAFNDSSASQPIQVQWGASSFAYTLPWYAAATFTWTGTQAGSYTIPARTQIQGSSYISQNGLASENAADLSGVYDLGYISDGAYAVYNNVDFGSAPPSMVNVRTASGGNGGTVEFRLDSPTGTLLATATLPVTGGCQTWRTVSAPAAGASGVHNLYIVFHGSGGIANVNWFQFQ